MKLISILALSATSFFPATLWAGIFSIDEPCPFEITADGTAEPLPYSRFKALFTERFEMALPITPLEMTFQTEAGEKRMPTMRGITIKRVEDRFARLGNLSSVEKASLITDLLRVGQPTDVLSRVMPSLGGRITDYALSANLAHTETVRGEWLNASRQHEDRTLELDAPEAFPNMPKDKLQWMLQVHRRYYTEWLRAHRRETLQRVPAEEQEVYPIFLGDTDKSPIRFVNASDKYEPGVLAESERAKLPKDAIAIVQQLLLWSPQDSRLLWLLAEVYTAEGRFKEAAEVFDQCTWGRQLTAQKQLMAHREVVQQAAANMKETGPEILDLGPMGDEEAEPKPEQGKGLFAVVDQTTFYTVVGGFVGFFLLIMVFKLRSRKR